MKTTLREATDGHYTVQYRIDSDGGNVEVMSCQFTPKPIEIDFCNTTPLERRIIQRIAEADADRHEREMRGGEEP